MKRRMIMVCALITVFTLGEFAWTESAAAQNAPVRNEAVSSGEIMPEASAAAM